jgi:hypothetical protein
MISTNELKTRQPIGTNQIVFGAYENAGTYDWGGELTFPSQTPSQKGRGVLVTATAKNQENLIADLAIVISKSATMTPEYTYKNYYTDAFGGGSNPLRYQITSIPLPIADSNKKQWQVFLVGNNGQFAYLKAQIIANDDVLIEVVQNI